MTSELAIYLIIGMIGKKSEIFCVIIFRYLAKEVYMALVVVAGFLLLTFLSNAFIRYLAKAAAGKLSGVTVMKIMALQIPYLLGLLLPVSLFIAFLLIYGRMYVDNEMTVLSACGMRQAKILKLSLLIGLAIFILDTVLVFYVSPKLSAYQESLLSVSQDETLLQTVQPGRFQVTNGGKNVYYIESVDSKNDRIHNIFIAQREKPTEDKNNDVWNVLSAQSGFTMVDPKTQDKFVVAENGFRYFGVPGEKAFRIVQFGEYGARIDNQAKSKTETDASLSLSELLHRFKQSNAALAELEWRISLILSIPILIFLVVPISKVRPRQGRYAQLLPAILIYAIYANMMFVFKGWVQSGKLPAYVGLWWLHAALLLVACLYWLDIPRITLRFVQWRNKA